jgi:hypothetical protein
MAALSCVLVGLAGAAGAAGRRLEARFGAEGLSGLEWTGIEPLAEGRPSVGKLVFETVTRNKDGLNEYAFEKADGSAPQVGFDARTKRLSYKYAWGAVEFTYVPKPNRLDLTVAISNQSRRTLADFDMKLGALAFPALPMGSDGFSARWSGQVDPRHSEEYTFYTRTDDGVRLWVDGRLIIDKWVNQGATEHSGKIELAAGRRYDVKMEYFENTGDAAARLSWSSPSREKEVIPSERLFPGPGGRTGGGTGLKAEYFSDKKLGKLRFTRTEPKVDFDWGTGSPEAPVALGGRGAVLSTLDNVGLVETAFGLRGAEEAGGMTERFALACLTMHPPVRMGLAPRPGGANTFDIVLRGGVWADDPGGVEIKPLGLPRVEPGKTLEIELSLRFGPADAEPDALVADVYERFRKYHGAPLEWPDRRGIAMIMLSSSWSGHKSATNPRGWFNEKKVDVVTEAGRADFRRRAIQYAERSVKILKDMNAQGIIAWDLEGQEHPHPTSFIGDPRLMKLLDPEMEAVADEFFKVFLDAGIRTGICIRPTQVYFNDKKKQWSHGTGSHGPERNPLGDDFGEVWPEGTPWWRFFPVVERMCRKIEYAKRRWKCSIFYVDTNGTWRPVGEKGEFKWMLLESRVWKEIRERHPDVLIVPELVGRTTACWAQTAPYFELDLGGVSTPARARRIFPDAFSVLNMCDGPFAERRAELVEAVRRGDILMFHGWWNPKRNQEVKSVYEEVWEGQPPGRVEPPKRKPRKLDDTLGDALDEAPDEGALVTPAANEATAAEPPAQTKEVAGDDASPVRDHARRRRKTSAMPYVVGGAVVAAAVAIGAAVLRGRGKRPSRRDAGREGGGRRSS